MSVGREVQGVLLAAHRKRNRYGRGCLGFARRLGRGAARQNLGPRYEPNVGLLFRTEFEGSHDLRDHQLVREIVVIFLGLE